MLESECAVFAQLVDMPELLPRIENDREMMGSLLEMLQREQPDLKKAMHTKIDAGDPETPKGGSLPDENAGELGIPGAWDKNSLKLLDAVSVSAICSLAKFRLNAGSAGETA